VSAYADITGRVTSPPSLSLGYHRPPLCLAVVVIASCTTSLSRRPHRLRNDSIARLRPRRCLASAKLATPAIVATQLSRSSHLPASTAPYCACAPAFEVLTADYSLLTATRHLKAAASPHTLTSFTIRPRPFRCTRRCCNDGPQPCR
jgi:hypothetical protein